GAWKWFICSVGAFGRTLSVQRVRLACGPRSPPRAWAFLSGLRAFSVVSSSWSGLVELLVVVVEDVLTAWPYLGAPLVDGDAARLAERFEKVRGNLRGDAHAVGPHPVVVDGNAIPDLGPLPLARGPGGAEDGQLQAGAEIVPVIQVHGDHAHGHRIVDGGEVVQVLPQSLARPAVSRGEDGIDLAALEARERVRERDLGRLCPCRAKGGRSVGIRRPDTEAAQRHHARHRLPRPDAGGGPRRLVPELLVLAGERA